MCAFVSFTMKLDELPGRKRTQRGILKELEERTQRRAVHQVGDALLQIVLHLIGLDAMPSLL